MTVKNTSGDAALLKFLARAQLVSGEVAQVAESEVLAQGSTTPLIDWLVQKGVMAEEDLAWAIAGQLRLPCVNLVTMAPDPAVTGLVREELATRCQVIPLRIEEGALVVATANPLDRDALRALEFATGRRVRLAVAAVTQLRDALEHAYHMDEALNQYLKGVPDEADAPMPELVDEGGDIRNLMRETTLPPVVKLYNLIVLEGIKARASDIHIEATMTEVRIRYRIDGILEESFRLPKWIQDPLIARFKVLAKLDITERRVPQDGRIHVRYRDSMIDLRVSSLPTQFGEKVTMRILDPSGAPSGLDQFGLPPRDLKCLRQAIVRPEGMILVTGPTGSGKSTTLYGMLAEVVSPTRNIVTIENPIEYQIAGVNQVEINEKQGLTFAGTLRSILRQDPDVILVGEIRDNETAQIAVRASQTGHLVLSTLHTNDAVATITRLVDIGIEPYVLASSLHLVIAQRLVRRTCEHCAEPYEPDPALLRALHIQGSGHQFRRGIGCQACRKSGLAGRLGVYEVMPVTPQLAKLIESKASETAIRLQARKDGMRSLAECAAEKVCIGITTVEEVLRVVDVPDDDARCPQCNGAIEENFAVCPHCATPLQCNCASCGMRLQKEWQICPYCGAVTKRVGGEKSAPTASGPATVARATVPPAAASPVATSPTVPAEASAARQYRALIVDDQADFRRLLTFTLEHSGLSISVVTASSGREALERVQNDPPDLILLDVMMPEMDGFSVCQQLRASVRTAFIPILMLTALDDPGNRARGFLVGTDDYVGKPFERTELLARVRRLLQRTYGAMLPPDAVTAADLPPLLEDAPPAAASG